MTLLQLNKKYLFTECEEFDFENPQYNPEQLDSDMKDSLIHYGGLGLAANQVGLNLSVFSMGPLKDRERIVTFFNPKIVHHSEEMSTLDEACLSFPGFVMKVARPKEVRVRFQDMFGKTQTVQLAGLSARCVSHETDHLRGLTFAARVSRLKLEMAIKKSNKLFRNGYTIADFGRRD